MHALAHTRAHLEAHMHTSSVAGMARRHAPLEDEEGEAGDEEGADDGGPHPQVLLHVRVRVPAEPRGGGQQEPQGMIMIRS